MLALIKKYYRVRNSSIANLLGKSMSFIYAVSVGRRSFSLPDLLLLKRYHDALELETPIESLSTSYYHTPQPTILDDQISRQIKTLERRKGSLLYRIESRETIERGLQACMSVLSSGDLSLEEKKWVDLRISHLESYLVDHPKEEELLLQAEIIGLESELSFLRDQL